MATMKQLLDTLNQAKARNVGSQNAVLDMVGEWKGMGQNLLESLGNWVADIEKREQNLISVSESLEERLKDLEKREKEFVGSKSELSLTEVELGSLLTDFTKEVEMKEEKLDEQLKLVNDHIENLEVAQSEVQDLKLQQREKLKEIEKKEREVDLIHGSLEERLRAVEQRESEFNSLHDQKLKEIENKEREVDVTRGSLEKRLSKIEQREKEVDSLHDKKIQEIEKKEREVDVIRGSLEKRLRKVEQRKKEFNLSHDEKLRELVLKEELLSKKKKEFVEEVNLAEEKFREGEKMGCGLIERLESALRKLEEEKTAINERIEEIELREAAAHESLTMIDNEAELIREQLEKQFEEFEKMLKEHSSSQEDTMQKLELKDQHPSVIREELLKEVKLVDEKIAGQQELGQRLLERLEELTAKKLSEMESLQLTLNVTSETFSAQDSDSDRVLADGPLQELKKREEEFRLYQEEKERKLELEEKKLRLIMEEFIHEVKYREEKFDEQEKLLYGLIRRLEFAQSNIADMNKMVNERFKELEFKAEKTRKRKKGIKTKEDGALPKENAHEAKKKELELEGGSLGSRRKELEWKEQNLEAFDFQEKNLDSIGEFGLNKLHHPESYSLNGEPSGSFLEEWEQKRQQLTNAFDAHLRTEPVGSADLKQAVDVKRLEMVVKNSGKDLDLMADEVYKILLLSPDPAKLVLDAIEGFCTSQFMNEDMELNMRTRILLLNELTKMSPNIQSCEREVAIKVAKEWKSKMRTAGENPFQVLEFLHLLAAYKLSSLCDKDELLSFLKTVAQHEQTPELCRSLHLMDKMQVFMQNLINEKQYLLASAYIHQCGLEKVFPQAAVLGYYVRHVKMLGKAKRNKEYNSSEAQIKAIFDEINDLRQAIEHIVKHGLESEYSPDSLMESIEALESDLTSLKSGIISSLSTDRHKQGKGKASSQLHDANDRETEQNEGKTVNEVVSVANSRLPEQGSDNRIAFGWKAQDRKRRRKRHHASQSFDEPLPQERKETEPFRPTEVVVLVDNCPGRHPGGYRKRHQTSFRDFVHHESVYEHHRLRH